MLKNIIYFIFINLITIAFLNAQSGGAGICANAEPLCGSNVFSYENSTGGSSAEAGPNYGCLVDQPNPSWFFLQIGTSGSVSITIEQSTVQGGFPNLDVDFILYGPFADTTAPCSGQLTGANTVDCSFLPNNVETVNIANAVAGEFYLLLITNFSGQAGFITTTQSGGTGTTNCGILADEFGCSGSDVTLDATTTGAANYVWEENDGTGTFNIILGENSATLNVATTNNYRAEAFDAAGNLIESYQFNVSFVDAPIANLVDDHLVCDDNNDGFTTIDFITFNNTVLLAQPAADFTISYHNSLTDAQMNMAPIITPYTNATAYTAETIFVRIENNLNTDCFAITDFEINVFNTPIANAVNNQLICDNNNDGFWDFDLAALRAIVLGAQAATDYTISFHPSVADATADSNALPDLYTNMTAYTQETIVVRIENNLNNNCIDTVSFNINVFDSPTANTVPSQLICDDNNDGLWAFNLAALEATVTATQSAADFTVTFHTSQSDADLDMGSLTLPYTNQVAYQEETIFARIENNDNSECFATTSFVIDVFNQPTATAFTFAVCDDSIDGDDTNGFTTFNLPSINSEILGTQDPTLYTVSYHFDQANADANTSPLTNNYINTTLNGNSIIARIENNDNTDCFETATIDLVVSVLPVITNAVELRQCDDDTDGFSDFNLTEANVLISTNSANETFTYYTNTADASTGTGAIVDPTTYTNTDASSNPDVLFVRVENAETCFRIAQLDILVSATQIPATVEILYETCDTEALDSDNTNGIEAFDFSDAELQIRAQAALPVGQNLTFTYYETEADALAEINAIPDISNHRNDASPFEQEIYVRVDSDVDNACVGLGVHVRLRTTNPTPNLDPDDIILCDDVTVGDLREVFDLTQNEIYIFNGDTNVSATYHLSIAEAEAGSGAILNPTMYTNTDPMETIYVRVENTTTGCFTRVSFDILVNPIPDANVVITDFIECENNTDFLVDFDLSTKDLEILNGQDPAQFTVTYHASQQDADDLTSPLSNPHENTMNPQQIFVAITNNTTDCSTSALSFNIEVTEGADANSDGELLLFEICDIVADNDGFAQFDLTTQDVEVLDGQDTMAFSLTYHANIDDATNNVSPLPTLYENLTNPQIIYARVSNNIAPDICFEVAELTLRVNLLPIFDLDDEYILCLTNNGTEVVDIPPVIDTGLPDADYSFEWSLNGAVLASETSSTLIPIVGGTYDVLVTDTSTSMVTMCTNTDSTIVTESEIPILTAEVTSEAFSGNNTISASATGTSTYEYNLDNGPWQDNGDFENVSSGEHIVSARDINGCGFVTFAVLTIDYPRYFTPNGDGNHERWNVVGIDTQPNAEIFIFDRYGKLLKQLSPTSQGWDGTYRGTLMPSSDYWFTLEYDEPITGTRKNFSAHFTLKR